MSVPLPTPDPWQFGWTEVIGLLNAIAVVFAAFVGAFGVRAWRIERIETRQSELAEEALAVMYRAFEIFDYIRNPGSFSTEGNTRVPSDDHETDEQKKERDYDFIPIERMNNEREFFNRVIDIRPSFKAVFGETSSAPLDKILELRLDVLIAARMMSRMRLRDHFRTDAQFEQHQKRLEKYETVLWKDYIKAIDENAKDPIDAPLEEAKRQLIGTVGKFLDKRLKRQT